MFFWNNLRIPSVPIPDPVLVPSLPPFFRLPGGVNGLICFVYCVGVRHVVALPRLFCGPVDCVHPRLLSGCGAYIVGLTLLVLHGVSVRIRHGQRVERDGLPCAARRLVILQLLLVPENRLVLFIHVDELRDLHHQEFGHHARNAEHAEAGENVDSVVETPHPLQLVPFQKTDLLCEVPLGIPGCVLEGGSDGLLHPAIRFEQVPQLFCLVQDLLLLPFLLLAQLLEVVDVGPDRGARQELPLRSGGHVHIKIIEDPRGERCVFEVIVDVGLLLPVIYLQPHPPLPDSVDHHLVDSHLE